MNMQNLMAQAKKLQNEMEKITKEIEETIFTYENENIIVEATGKNKIQRIQILNESVLEDKEIFEDIIVVAVNDVLDQIKSKKDEKLGKYTNGLGGLF
jgi:DNA-binding YbaB/EbfC family protein